MPRLRLVVGGLGGGGGNGEGEGQEVARQTRLRDVACTSVVLRVETTRIPRAQGYHFNMLMIVEFRRQQVASGCLGSRVVSVLDSGAEGPGFKSQSRRCRVTVLGKPFTPIVPVFTKQQNWYQPS